MFSQFENLELLTEVLPPGILLPFGDFFPLQPLLPHTILKYTAYELVPQLLSMPRKLPILSKHPNIAFFLNSAQLLPEGSKFHNLLDDTKIQFY